MSVEQTYRRAAWAHLTAVLNVFTLIGGVIAAALMYLWLRRQSPLAAFHALQALLMQLVLWVGGGLVTVGLFVLANQALRVSGFGIILWPLAFVSALFPLASAVYGAYGAWVTNSGVDFEYYKVGEIAIRIIQKQEARF